MMKVEQFPYLSPEAMELRRRDGIPPWGVHPCEVDSLEEPKQHGPFRDAWREAMRMRREIESE
jgi:hypothetical protein